MRKLVALVAGSVALVVAVAAAGQSPVADDGDALSVAALNQPVGETSQFLPCLCPICIQMRDNSDGASFETTVPAHVAGVGFA